MINVRSKQKWIQERNFSPIHCTLNTLKMNMIIFEQLSGNGIHENFCDEKHNSTICSESIVY